ncbi:MAG: hypothetical protein EHM13_01795, partial [Acidobacteria bacterium]
MVSREPAGTRKFVPHPRRALAFLAGVALVCSPLALDAQRGGGQRAGAGGRGPQVHSVGGVRDGASFFPKVDYPQTRPLKPGEVDFKHFHTPEESLSLMQAWEKKYPDLVEVYSVGKSFEGRDIWQMTIANEKTGRDTDKPAFFIEGGRHAGESSGSEATLYFIHHVLSNYGTDPEITKLVDTRTLYCKPHNNPDGNTLYLTTAQTLRSTVRPNDDDGDGLLDEDPGDDLDGDGFVRQMRKYVGSGKGTASKDPNDPSGRLMGGGRGGGGGARGGGAPTGDYVTYGEGIDNDGDGR